MSNFKIHVSCWYFGKYFSGRAGVLLLGPQGQMASPQNTGLICFHFQGPQTPAIHMMSWLRGSLP